MNAKNCRQNSIHYQAKINSAPKDIGKLMATGNKTEAEKIKAICTAEWKAPSNRLKKSI